MRGLTEEGARLGQRRDPRLAAERRALEGGANDSRTRGKFEFCVVGQGLVPFPEPDTKTDAPAVVRQGGGLVATTMVACARLGLRAKYIGKVGADDPGSVSRETLRKEGIDVEEVIVDPGQDTRLTFGLIERDSGRRTLIRAAMRPARLGAGELTRAAVTGGRLLHLDGYERPAALQAARWARDAGIPVSLDAEEATERRDELLPLADILIEAGHAVGDLLEERQRVLVVDQGVAGSSHMFAKFTPS